MGRSTRTVEARATDARPPNATFYLFLRPLRPLGRQSYRHVWPRRARNRGGVRCGPQRQGRNELASHLLRRADRQCPHLERDWQRWSVRDDRLARRQPGTIRLRARRIRERQGEHPRQVCLVIWIGESTKVMRKARVSVESGDVNRVLSHHSIAVTASDRSELEEKDMVVRLRKAGGADYNGGRG